MIVLYTGMEASESGDDLEQLIVCCDLLEAFKKIYSDCTYTSGLPTYSELSNIVMATFTAVALDG